MRVQSRQWPDGVSLDVVARRHPAGGRDERARAHRGDAERGRRPAAAACSRARRRPTHHVRPEAFSPDGGALVYEDGGAAHPRRRDAHGRACSRARGDGRRLRAPAWSPKGDRIAAVNDGGGIELIDPALGYGPTIPTAHGPDRRRSHGHRTAPTLALQYKRPNESRPDRPLRARGRRRRARRPGPAAARARPRPQHAGVVTRRHGARVTRRGCVGSERAAPKARSTLRAPPAPRVCREMASVIAAPSHVIVDRSGREPSAGPTRQGRPRSRPARHRRRDFPTEPRAAHTISPC